MNAGKFFFFIIFCCQLFANEKYIEKIVVNREEIFDTSKKEESGFFYRATNFVHTLSKEDFIRRELSFKEGDPCDPLNFEESERKLRKTGLLNPVSIIYEETEKGCIVYVNTRDTWTTKPGVSFNVQGDVTTYSIELQEDHFMGLGKSLLFSFEKEVDDEIYLLSYDDLQVFGTNLDGGISFWHTREGIGHEYYISAPFDHINVERGFSFKFLRERRGFTLYWEGKKTYKFILKNNFINLNLGKKISQKEGEVLRFYLFFERNEREFVKDEVLIEGSPFKKDGSYSFNYFGFLFEKIFANYIKTKNLQGFTSDEDFLIGPRYSLHLGFSSPLWGGDESQLLKFYYEDGKVIKNLFWQRKTRVELRTKDEKFLNSYYSLSSNLYYKFNPSSTFIFAFQFDGFINANLDGVLYLGNEEGQRGYGYNFESGSKRLRMTILEKNLIFKNVLSISNVGIAFFADAGKVWGWGKDFGEQLIYFDIGVGLRFEMIRSKIVRISRIDFAYGFKENGGFQISLASGEWFF